MVLLEWTNIIMWLLFSWCLRTLDFATRRSMSTQPTKDEWCALFLDGFLHHKLCVRVCVCATAQQHRLCHQPRYIAVSTSVKVSSHIPSNTDGFLHVFTWTLLEMFCRKCCCHCNTLKAFFVCNINSELKLTKFSFRSVGKSEHMMEVHVNDCVDFKKTSTWITSTYIFTYRLCDIRGTHTSHWNHYAAAS